MINPDSFGGRPKYEVARSSEIARKFRIHNPPTPEALRFFDSTHIDQGYIAVDKNGTEVRVRGTSKPQTGYKFSLTVKSIGGLIRYEEEITLDPAQYHQLWPATEGRRIQKTRYKIPYGVYTIELDVYDGNLCGLVVAEVEFPEESMASTFTPPDWFCPEVTEDQSFKNQQLAINGMPQ